MSQLICQNCQQVFASSLGKPTAAQKLSKVLECEDCNAETHSTTECSPGIVLNDEMVASCACHPYHVLEDGSLSPETVAHAYAQGMSVTRLSKVETGEAHVMNFCAAQFTGQGKGARGKKKAVGIAVVRTGDAREVFYDTGGQAFKVYDTANPTMGFHADIFATAFFGNSEELSLEDQAVRLAAQMALIDKMELKPLPT
ncbi:hypothetical protein [Pseudomonas parafulva]|uniref:hypothetical protein n=1 Tax=Pseudomonas parafulva TaxID=157782 RepID=UPI0005410D27|nr:hypothetical protein [Pseudomonas parafulva]AIZ34975.1 hypothetical protein NJ69_19185 [Pseudomonas parafulva]